MILALALGFGLGVLATVLAGERDKRRPVRFSIVVPYRRRVASSIRLGVQEPAIFGDVSLTKCSEPTYGRSQDHT